MMNKSHSNVEHIIAKIDNDFNPDNSDWIPRVAAWTIDCMSQIKVLNTIKKKRTLKVYDRIAISPCPISKNNLIVYDNKGCIINKYESNNKCECFSFTGEDKLYDNTDTVTIEQNEHAKYAPGTFAEYNNSKSFEDRHNIKEYNISNNFDKSYILISDNKLELTFDTDIVVIENEELETYYSNYFNCELPVIPNNGILLEAIAAYCMYKMLLRGYKHPILNLTANNPAINPYMLWNELKYKAKTSIINSLQGNIDTNMWKSYFYNYTFYKK